LSFGYKIMLLINFNAFPITNMWQVYTRPTSASDFFLFELVFCQQHELRSHFLKLFENGGSIQNGEQNKSFQHFFNPFYLSHMEHEGSIGFVMRKMKKKIIADFHVLVLFMAKKHDLSDKKNSVCHAPLPLPYAKIYFTYRLGLKW
jgi:hypothetical protein